MGKTRLALQVAAELEPDYPDGVFFISLADVRDSDLVMPTIAKTLGIRDMAGASLSDMLSTALFDKRVLLMLDNLEQVLAAGPLLSSLLDVCTHLQMLATSRAPLHVHAEHLLPLQPLPTPKGDQPLSFAAVQANPAVTLLAERARQRQPTFAVTAANAVVVSGIVNRLDGLPLAIELAALRLQVLSPEALLAQLDHRLHLLTHGPHDVPSRLQSMRDAVAWSHDLLSAPAQSLFQQLSVFAGSFTRDGAAAIASLSGPELLDVLQELLDQSLLQRIETPAQDDANAPRFFMLETMREYGLARLAERHELAVVEAAHASYVRDLVEAAEPHLLGPDERRWSAQLDAEFGTIRAALAWAIVHDADTALRIAGALWTYWVLRVHVSEGRTWLDRAIAAGPNAAAAWRAKAHTAAALLAGLPGDVAATIQHAQEGATLARETGAIDVEARAYTHESVAAFFTGEPDRAIVLLNRGLALLDDAPTSTNRAWSAFSRAYRGLAAAMTGDMQQAIADYEQALEQAHHTGSDLITLFILNDFAGLLVDAGYLPRARAVLAQALAIAPNVRDAHPRTQLLVVLAAADAAEGMAELAARRLGAIEVTYRLAGFAMPLPFHQRMDRAIAQAKTTLGTARFAAAWKAGSTHPAEALPLAFAADHVTQAVLVDAHGGIRFGLTPRELNILNLMVDGQTDREIATQLFISRKTASNHVSNILAKLGVGTRSAAVARAIREDLI